ncbi:uncharacterized protein LOC133913401 isoform X1 [Phragmites australis]|uniref:uncharacterized protein LOC133913401 isoform X1 n=1 Tax=Phragmites australis TaxID=29695 RepID=UPI002D7873BA|nr:uncharacterized protein LOC133913401 isoform X1 [Phragmites australis]
MAPDRRRLQQANMSPRLPQGIAEMDREFDELASDGSMAGREQLSSHTRERTASLPCPHASGADQFGSDIAVDENEQINAAALNTGGPAARNGRKVTINEQLRKRRAKGKQIDIKFPLQFAKVCGKHASLFKNEISVIVRTIPLRVKKWREMETSHPGTIEDVWQKLKGKFPELLEEHKGYATRQVESQYNNRRYRLLQAYRQNKQRLTHVAPEEWRWLITNLWTDPDFQKRSNQNSLNRGKQEMRSKVGTKSIAQIAYDLRDPETGAWPTAMQVWRATYQKADGTWSVPSGEETLTKLHEVAQTHEEQISAAHVPMVEHFALVLGRKPNHSRGVGNRAVNRVGEERIKLREQIEASDQRAAAAQERAEAAEQRAQAAEQRAQVMEAQVCTMVQSNAQLQEE